MSDPVAAFYRAFRTFTRAWWTDPARREHHRRLLIGHVILAQLRDPAAERVMRRIIDLHNSRSRPSAQVHYCGWFIAA